MTIEFYNNISPINKINKSIGSKLAELQGTLKDNTDIMNPTILIESAAVPAYNYAYIPEFGRYYNVAPPTSIRTNLWELSMHVDALYTFKTGLLNANCILKRSSDRFNLYLNDPEMKCVQNEWVTCQPFPSGFNTDNATFVLALIGDRVQE